MKKTRMTADNCSSLFWLVLGLLVCYRATQLGIGNLTDPGSGFIFFWSGSILALFSLMLLVGSLRNIAPEAREVAGTNWAKISLVLLSLVLYAFFLEKLGFVATTFLLLSFLLGISEGVNWLGALGVAGAAALGSFVVFEVWLKIRLPMGILGF